MSRAKLVKGGVVASVVVALAVSLGATGCAIHTQGDIREIAYDFSDRDFYDRAYAPSPKYLETEELYRTVPERTAAQAERAPAPQAIAPTAAPAPVAVSVPVIDVETLRPAAALRQAPLADEASQARQAKVRRAAARHLNVAATTVDAR
jgi:predicted acylesterase/phospholipase RssA